jgi:hypothetical protein
VYVVGLFLTNSRVEEPEIKNGNEVKVTCLHVSKRQKEGETAEKQFEFVKAKE